MRIPGAIRSMSLALTGICTIGRATILPPAPRAKRRTLLAFPLLLLSACSGSSDSTPTSPSSASIAGSYHLTAMGGNNLPFTYQSGTTKYVVTSDVLTVAEGGTWTESGAYTQTVGGVASNQVISDGGSWTRAGSAVSFNHSNGTVSYSGQFTGSGFTLSDETFTYTFTK